jgi:nucleoside phosphorylase
MGRTAPPCDTMSEPYASVGASGRPDLCVVTAVDVEFKIAAGLLSEKSFSEESHMKICRGLFGGRRVTILQSGMGATGFAEGLVEHRMNNRYDALIIAGLAGGLDPRLRVGDAVIYNLCYDARGVDFSCRENPDSEEARKDTTAAMGDELLSGFLSGALTRAGLTFIEAPGITVSRIVTDAKEKLALGAHYGASAVDMETYQALSACERLGLPAAALRVISDEAGRDIPDFNQIYNANGRINGWRMASAMMARPSAALRLLKTIRPALQSFKVNLQAAMGL